MRHRRWRDHHVTVAAYLALFLTVAGGAAVAAETIDGRELIDGTVGTAELAPGAVSSDKLGALQTASSGSFQTIVNGGEEKAGPKVRVSLARRSLVAVMARVDIQAERSGTRSGQAGIVRLRVPAESGGGAALNARIMSGPALQTPRFVTKYTGFGRPSNLDPEPGADRGSATWLTFDLPPGEHDISLAYQNQFNQRTRFRNATLYAWAMPTPVLPGSPTAPANQPSIPGLPQQGPSGPAVR